MLTPQAEAFMLRRCPPPTEPQVLFPGVPAPPRVLITGAQGFLGVRLGAFLLRAGFADADALALDTVRSGVIKQCTRASFDLTSEESVRAAVKAFAPDIVFHCAAVSDTGQAERQPELSYAVNVQATLCLADACRTVGARLVAMSSDQVYCGTHLPGDPALPETAPLAPENVYGKHKLQAEQRVLTLLPEAVFLRLPWMYDTLDTPFRSNRNLLCALDSATVDVPARFAVRERRAIADVWQVVRALPMAAYFAGGVYNFGGENNKTTYETARTAAALLNKAEGCVQADEARFAPTGRNLAMDCTKARAAGASFPDTCAGLAMALGAAQGGARPKA